MMKHLIILAMLLSLFALLSGTDKADNIKQNTDFRKTLDKLQKLEKSGLNNPNLYYNIGVCYYQLGESGKATLFFLRALNLESSHKPARQNLEFIQMQNPETAKQAQRSFISMALLGFYHSLSLNRLALLMLLFIVALTSSVHWLLHYPPEREKGLPILVLGIVIIILLGLTTTYFIKYYRFSHNHKAVVTARSAEVFASATDSKAMKILPEASIITIAETQDKRTEAFLADGSIGWIDNKSFERVTIPTTGNRRQQ